ncbi:MAG: ATP-binding protein [bacterium]
MSEYQLRIHRELDTEKNAVKKIEPYLFELKESLGIKDETFYNLLIAVSEAVNNAVFHGNECNPDKKVIVLIQVNNRDIEVSVSDEGKGFDLSKLEDPREPENLLKASGRGVFLINELSHKTNYKIDSSGVTVQMIFHV